MRKKGQTFVFRAARNVLFSARCILSHGQNHYNTAPTKTAIFTVAVPYSRAGENDPKKHRFFHGKRTLSSACPRPLRNVPPRRSIVFFLRSSSLSAKFFTDALRLFYEKMHFVAQNHLSEIEFGRFAGTRQTGFGEMAI